MKIINIVGARPNFMKIAPLIEEMKKHSSIQSLLVHTGQHYDVNMSKLFFEDLGLPQPDIDLEVGSGSHAEQTARIMVEYEKVLLREKPDVTLVVGDVNSTIACALTSVKLGIPVAHVEAGLRSFDRTMPEEINRILTDAISEYLFITERSAKDNLRKEGVAEDKIYFVGNVMIDSLLKHRQKANRSAILKQLEVKSKNYALLTLHRPSNVDDKEVFCRLLDAISVIQKEIPIIYPAHPRTQKRIKEFGLADRYPFLDQVKQAGNKSFSIIDPLGYLDFMQLMDNAKLVLTDSGGIQEETTVLNVPCITLRENTERPITVNEGSNVLTGTNTNAIVKEAMAIIQGQEKTGRVPELWDGKAAERIVKVLIKKLGSEGQK